MRASPTQKAIFSVSGRIARSSAFATVAGALVLATACAPRPSIDVEAVTRALEQRERSFLAALSERDLEQTATHFADDAVLHVANMPPVRGREAIEQFYGKVFRFLGESQATPARMHVSSGGDMAYSAGSVANAFDGEQERVEYVGKYLIVWERRDDDWWIVVYSVSNDSTPAFT